MGMVPKEFVGKAVAIVAMKVKVGRTSAEEALTPASNF